jgi:hypothetical protein
MRVHLLAPIAVCLIGGMLFGQTIEQRLAWARSAIDAHAETRFVDPSGVTTQTHWQVERIEGCSVTLKQTWQKQVWQQVRQPQAHTGDSQPVSEKVTTYAFDLRDLKPAYVGADSSTGYPQVTIFALGDVFHLTSSFTQAAQGESGESKSWSVSSNTRNIWIYFDSASADNLALVKRVRDDLQAAIRHCGMVGPHHKW